MKPCFGYIRVSTQKQGEGVSLEAQRDAITVFASRNDLTITAWFEEKETAAKTGRPVFQDMLKRLHKREASGLIMHKIDRSARNHRDWADIGDLSDAGIDIHFATESLDFRSRGGRLTADIQAVIAADYIRNLREETVKGMNGRLKQGLYPFRAPLGYRDNGGGNAKTVCPKSGPLVRKAFEMYATGQYSYSALLTELHHRGLRNIRGGRITLNGLTKIFSNQFYTGLIYIKTTGKTFKGVHEPLISLRTWEQVQRIKSGRCGPKVTRQNHLFQGLFRCAHCSNPMVPERQKGRVYYRCTRKYCPTKTIREDVLELAILTELGSLQISARAIAAATKRNTAKQQPTETASERSSLELQIKDDERRLERLQDLLLDDRIDVETFDLKNATLLRRLCKLRERLAALPDEDELDLQKRKLAELQSSLVLLYKMSNRTEKRMIVENVWPNRTVSGKEPYFEPNSWVARGQSTCTLTEGDPERDRARTLVDLLDEIRSRQLNDEDS